MLAVGHRTRYSRAMAPPPLQQTKAPGSLRSCLLYIGVFALAFFLVFFAACVITYMMPKKFESSAVIEVKPLSHASGDISKMTPQFFATEFEVIRSQQTLKIVVQRLDLTTRWNMTEEEAIAILRGIVDAQNVRGTDLIAINVKHTNQEDARDIAKELYQAYKKRREDKDQSDTNAISRIEIHEEPFVAQYPSSPNVTLNLLIGAGVGLVLGLLLALIVRLFAGRRVN